MKSEIEKYVDKITELRHKSLEDFMLFFNNDRSVPRMIEEGGKEFEMKIMDLARPRMGDNKLCLEIGHGGGRLILHAAKNFERAVGVDIHNENDYVMEFLNSQGVDNVFLRKGDGEHLPFQDGVFDLVYSHIVFQHMEKEHIVMSNLREAHRVLKDSGVAVIYLGRVTSGNRNVINYNESPLNHTNIRFRDDYAILKCREIGFDVVGKYVPDRRDGLKIAKSRQLGLILKKHESTRNGA